jgi:aminoglycoside phosphotransferase (APT) family kinase protein
MTDSAFVDLADDRAALLGLLVRLGLAEVGDQPVVQALRGGVSSNILRVQLAGRPDCCVKQALPRLKVDKEWAAPTDRVFAEIDWLELASRVIPHGVPRVRGVDRGLGAFVMDYLPEDLHRNWKTELLAGRIDMPTAAAVAEMLGLLHAHSAGNDAVASRFRTDANFFALRLDPYLLEAARQHPDLDRPLLALVETTRGHRLALVHGDVSPKNILLAASGPVLLDAECAWYGDPAFDLAFLLNHILLKSAHRPLQSAEWARVFSTIVDGHRQHVSWEAAEAFDRRVAALLPGLMLARIDGKSPVEYLLPPVRARIRQAARGLIQQAPQTTDALLQRWLALPAASA